MKITKKLREEAALLCALIASTDHPDYGGCACAMCIQHEAGIGDDAWMLAISARDAIPREWRSFDDCDDYWLWFAEAEAMLRTGWTP